MSGTHLIAVNQLDKLILKQPSIKQGCLLDTNILISASITVDPANDAAESLLEELAKLEIPIYSNVNIRAEFLEIQRRILIPECLIEFYESRSDHVDFIAQKLKSVQTSYRKSLTDKKVYKFNDDRIKEFREIFSKTIVNEEDGWIYFCKTFLAPQLTVIWDEVVQLFNLNFIKIRDDEDHHLLIDKVSWDGVTEIMRKYGTSSADAMILNLLLCSKIELVATGDSDIKYLSDILDKYGKIVLQI